jgi:two-component sensor histidine kinase
VGGVVGIVDVDAERRLVEHQRLLMAELSHRVKNMLAVVQGIASSTLRRSCSLDDFGLAFEGRLQALSTAHTQLLRTDWRGAQLRGLLDAVLAPHAAGDRLAISGSDVALDARQGVALALVLHELATNAARHGALAAPAGRIAIAWDTQAGTDGPRLHLRWAETGLPGRPVIGRNGLGMRLITRSVEVDLGGQIDLQMGENDLAWIMEFGLQPHPEPEQED